MIVNYSQRDCCISQNICNATIIIYSFVRFLESSGDEKVIHILSIQPNS